MGHDSLGLIRTTATKDVAEATGRSGGLGLITDAHSTHVEEIDAASSTAGSSNIVLVFVLFLVLFFVIVDYTRKIRHVAAGANHKCFRRLVVDGTEGGNLADEDIEQVRLKPVCIILDDGLVTKNNELGSLGISRQKTPVDETTVTEVGVVGLLRGKIEDTLHHVLSVLWILQEALDGGREQLELDGGIFLFERFKEGIEQLVGIVNALGVLADDPDHTGLSLRLIQIFEVVTECGDDGLVPVGVATEDVLDDNDTLLNDVVDLGLDEFEEDSDAALGGTLELNGAPADSTDGLADEVHVDLGGVLLELKQNLVDVALRHKLDDDLELLHLDVNGVVVFRKEDFDFTLKDARALLNDEIDIAEGNILDLGLGVQEGDERRGKLAGQVADGIGRGTAGSAHHLHVGEDDLHSAHDDGRVGMLKTGSDPFDDPLRFARVGRDVLRKRVQDEDLSPLGAFVERGKELLQDRGTDLHHILSRGLGNLAQGSDGVGHDGGVGVGNEIVKYFEEASLLDQLWFKSANTVRQ